MRLADDDEVKTLPKAVEYDVIFKPSTDLSRIIVPDCFYKILERSLSNDTSIL